MGNKSSVNATKILKAMNEGKKEMINSKFTENELKVLYMIFNDLAMSDKHSMHISKQAFLKFFNLPGVIGMRLYKYFSYSSTNGINFEEFITCIGAFAKSTGANLMQALFNLYDTDNDGLFGIDDLITLMRTYEKSGIVIDLNKLKHKTLQKKKFLSGSSTSGSSKSLSLEAEGDDDHESESIENVYISSERVLKVAKRLFKKSGFYHETHLDFEQFCVFIQNNEYFLKAVVCSMRKDLWSEGNCGCQDDAKLLDVCKSLIPTAKASSLSVFRKEIALPSKHQEQENSKDSISIFTSAKKADFEGFLRKKGKKSGQLKKRYYFIKGNLLYYYDKQSETVPKDITFMPNRLFKKEVVKGKYCISVYTYDSLSHYKTLYAASEEERDQWYEAMLVASNNADITKNYKMKETLGVGKFSTVRKAYSITDDSHDVAIKIISKRSLTEVEREYILNELTVLSTVCHPNIPTVYGVHETPERLMIVMENIKGGELFEYLIENRKLPEEEATDIVFKLTKIVKYLSELKIMHRDIKTENMLITKTKSGLAKNVYLIDFGLAKFIDSREEVNAKLGTLGYCAPEVILKNSYNGAVDVWGIGMVYYLLLTGKLPFDSKSSSDIAEKTVKNPLPLGLEIFEEMDAHVPKFLEQACAKDPSVRLTIDECVNHSAFAI